jgi:hypothetical protein
MVSINAKIKIETNSDKVYYALRKAFSEISENRNGNALATGFGCLEKTLSEEIGVERDNIKISYNGNAVAFEMDTEPYSEMDTELYEVNKRREYGVYHNSNEEYTKATVDDIGKLSGITNYFGISGGLTQVFTHLSALEKRNRIENVTLCDTNRMQLLYNSMQLVRYDAMNDSINPMWHIKANDSVELRKALFEYGNSSIGGLRFKLINSDFEKLLDGINPGKNFIYSSNAYRVSLGTRAQGEELHTKNCWKDNKSGERILETLRNSSRIENGSTYMAASVYSSSTIMLRKERNDMRLYSYCYGEPHHDACVHQ